MAKVRADYAAQLKTVNTLRAELASLRPKPLKERLLSLLQTIDARVEPTLRSGKPVGLDGRLTQAVFNQLEGLLKEPGAAELVSLRPTGMVEVVVGGSMINVHIEVSLKLLDE